MSTLFTIKGTFNEDGSATCLGRLTARDATGVQQPSGRKLLKQADTSTVSVAVFDLQSSTPDTVTYSASLTVSAVIFDTLQTDWDVDSVGYNFKHTIPTTAFPTGGHVHRAEYKITTTGGTVMWARYEGPAVPVSTS